MFYSKKIKKLGGVLHFFFTRKGGFSKGHYRGLNCGRGSKDNKKNIVKNLKFVSKKMRVKSDKLILMYQTHSNKVLEIRKKNLKKIIYSDAIVTKINDIALGVVTADCVPILIYDYKNKVVGCIHAGWKGAFTDIIKNTVNKIRKLNSNQKIYACIGPCIGKDSYEVDLKFYKKFIIKSKKNKKYFLNKNEKKKLFNLREFVADKLTDLNVDVDHINLDTFKEKNYFFSYRRSLVQKQKDYGRCISAIRLL
jgi:YfiH family protein